MIRYKSIAKLDLLVVVVHGQLSHLNCHLQELRPTQMQRPAKKTSFSVAGRIASHAEVRIAVDC